MNRRFLGFALIGLLSILWSQTLCIGADKIKGSNGGNAPVAAPGLLPAPPPPVNDDFANATLLTGASGTVTGTNVGATKEPGEPPIESESVITSVWWSWTAPFTGNAVFDTFGSTIGDTLLAVYTGSSVSALTLINADDDATDGNLLSQVVFPAVSGTTYKITVAGFSGTSGTLTLNWTAAQPAPANDLFANATAISGATGTLT